MLCDANVSSCALDCSPIQDVDGRRAAPCGLQRLPADADLVTAGLPCQPFFVAGRRAGSLDSRATSSNTSSASLNTVARDGFCARMWPTC